MQDRDESRELIAPPCPEVRFAGALDATAAREIALEAAPRPVVEPRSPAGVAERAASVSDEFGRTYHPDAQVAHGAAHVSPHRRHARFERVVGVGAEIEPGVGSV